MKGRSGSTGVETKHEVSSQLDLAKRAADRQSFSGTHSTFQPQPKRGRLAAAVGGLAIALLVGVFFFSYGSRVYENWRERRLLHQATTLLQEGELSKAAQMAHELARRHPDSLAALSILADTAERQNLEEAIGWRERIARLLPKEPESQLNLASAALRFGKLDLAREALNRVSSKDRDSAAFMLLLVGCRAQKAISSSRRSNSLLRYTKSQRTISINSIWQHFKFVPKTRKRARTRGTRSTD